MPQRLALSTEVTVIRRRSAERAALPLLIGAALVAFVLVGVATGGSGHGAKPTTVQNPSKKAAATPTNRTPPTAVVPRGGISAGEAARGFAVAFEAESWNDAAGSLGQRVAPWSAPSLESLLSTPAQAGLPAVFVASRSVTSAKVSSVSIDPVDSTDDLALVSLSLTTTSTAGPATSGQKVLPLELTRASGRWVVSSVPGLVP